MTDRKARPRYGASKARPIPEAGIAVQIVQSAVEALPGKLHDAKIVDFEKYEMLLWEFVAAAARPKLATENNARTELQNIHKAAKKLCELLGNASATTIAAMEECASLTSLGETARYNHSLSKCAVADIGDAADVALTRSLKQVRSGRGQVKEPLIDRLGDYIAADFACLTGEAPTRINDNQSGAVELRGPYVDFFRQIFTSFMSTLSLDRDFERAAMEAKTRWEAMDK